MRIRTGLVLGLLLALSVAGCGDKGGGAKKVATAGNGAKASSSAKASNGPFDPTKYAQCMRENGVPDFPDPEVDADGRIRMSMPQGVDGQQLDKTVLDAATAKCKQYMPNGGEPPQLDAKQLEQQRKYAQCMRENGLPNFPDPEANGGIRIQGNSGDNNADNSGMNPDDPTFKAAEKACEKYQGGAKQIKSGDGK
jgi:hypothetical protein